MSAPRTPDGEQEPVVIRDKRRIDPSGEPRIPDQAGEPAAASTAAAGAPAEELAALQSQLDERTADLQRLQAEFANYRKRVERDRVVIGEQAVGGVIAALLPVLDDIDRARSHGDLTGAFKAVADQFDAVLAKLGLQPFGDEGDPFDPAVHEAVMHSESDQVSQSTASTIMRKGYKHGERLLRPAMVGVTDPSVPVSVADAARSGGDDEPAVEPGADTVEQRD